MGDPTDDDVYEPPAPDLPPDELEQARAAARAAGRISESGYPYDEDNKLLLTPEESAELVAEVQERASRDPDQRDARQREAHERELDEHRGKIEADELLKRWSDMYIAQHQQQLRDGQGRN